MAHGVVYVLQAVQVDQHHRDMMALTSRRSERGLQGLVESTPVARSSQRVGTRCLLQAVEQLLGGCSSHDVNGTLL
jgi:hypothetical protein